MKKLSVQVATKKLLKALLEPTQYSESNAYSVAFREKELVEP